MSAAVAEAGAAQGATSGKLWSIEANGDGTGKLKLYQHPGQLRAWDSLARFVVVLAGTQGGKTSWGPHWLWREVERCGAGDYLAVTASYDLFKLKMLPVLRELFEHTLRIGRYWASDRIIELADVTTGKFMAQKASDPMWGRIILRSADAQGGLESNTANAAWLDEAGQPSFTVDTWEAVLRRLSLARGRALITTTIYQLGWLKSHLYDKWRAGDPSIEVIQFDSTDNPSFPQEEYERAKRDMPLWKFNMFYRGRFDRPAGLIYDSFDEDKHKIPRRHIPPSWPRFLGLDFGGVNTAGMFYAQEPNTPRLYAYREYHAGQRTAKEHAAALLKDEPGIPRCVGGSKSEGQWRSEFAAAGLPVLEPDVSDVFLQIERVYGAHKRDEILVFDDLTGYLDEKTTYSYVVDERGEVVEPLKIEDKHRFHRMDAERYIVSWLKRGKAATRPAASEPYKVGTMMRT